MALPTPPPYDQPIPNNPFYSLLQNSLQSEVGPLVIGQGLYVDYTTGIIAASGSGGGVDQLVAGDGIAVSNSGVGTVTISNTGVLDLTAGFGITIVPDGVGGFTISQTAAAGGVSSITAGGGLTGGTITTSGTIALPNLLPNPTNVYNYPSSITFDNYGRAIVVDSGEEPVAATCFTAKGQLAVSTGIGTYDVLPAGPTGYVLTGNSTDPNGMVWAPPTGGGGGSVSISGNFPITVTGTPENPIISIVQASTTNCGAVVLNNTTTSTSVVQALTANAGKNLQDQIDAITSSGGTVQVVTGSAPVQITGDPAIAPNVTVQAGSTSSIGVVQLYDDTNSDSTTLALTANVGKTLQEQINTLVISTNLILAGTIDASTGLMKTVNVDGTAAGFVVGSPLPLPTPARANYFVIITVAGTMTPPGGVPTACIKGDWWLCDGVQWKLVDVGTILPYATEDQPGAVCLATNLETQDGLINNKAIVPTALQSKISNSINLPSSDFIASSCAVKIAYDHATGAYAPYATQLDCGTVCLATSAEVLEGTNPNKAIVPLALQQKMSDSITTFDSNCIASSAAVAAAATTVSDKIDRSTFTARGQVIASTGVGTYEATCCNVNGRALTVDSTSPTGLSWCPVGCGSVCIISTGIGLSGGPITSSGTISLENTTVVPGCYAYPTICVDQQGRLTFACSNASAIGNAQPQFRGFVYGSTNGFSPITGEPVGTTALGFCALNALPTDGGSCNTALGTRAGSALTSGFNNLLLGAGAGCDITSGVCNVIITPTAIPTGNISCRLVMSNGANTWIEGTAAGSVCFPNGIEDCVASTGLPGYVLTSTGTNLEWAQPREFSSSCGIYCTVPTAADASCLIPVWFFTDNPNAVPDYSAALKVNVGVSYNSVGGFVCGAACVFYAQYNPVTPGFENVVYGDPVLFDNRDTPNNFSSLALNWSFANACYGNFSAFGVLYNTCLCGGADFSVQQLMTVSV